MDTQQTLQLLPELDARSPCQWGVALLGYLHGSRQRAPPRGPVTVTCERKDARVRGPGDQELRDAVPRGPDATLVESLSFPHLYQPDLNIPPSTGGGNPGPGWGRGLPPGGWGCDLVTLQR